MIENPAATLTQAQNARLYTSEEVMKLVSASGPEPLVLLFGSKACRACRQLQPRLAKYARKESIAFCHVDHGAATDDAFQELNIVVTPTLALLLPDSDEPRFIDPTVDAIAEGLRTPESKYWGV